MPGVALIWDFIGRDQASPALNRIAVSADRAAAATGRAETGLLGFSKKAVAALGALAAVDVLGHFAKDAAQFQKSMTLIQTQAGASAQQVQKFSGAILSLSGKVAQAPEDLSTSLYHVYSALNKVGATAPQMMNTVKIAAEGAKVGMASVEDTTNSLTATLASGIVRFNQAGKAMGALNAIVGAGDMHFQDLNDALGTGLLVTMKTFGVSLTDTGAALAVFGDNNIRGADAATKLRMAVQDLAKPAAHADEFLAKIGLTAAQLRATLEKNGLNGALHLLNDRMTQAGITGSKVGGFLEDAFTKKAGTGLAILTQRMHQFDEARAQVERGANGFGDAWQAVTKTASYQMDRLGSMVQVAAIQIGTKLLPAVTSAAQWLGDHVPKALHTLGQIVSPLAHVIGSALGGAFHLLVDVLRPVAHALGAIGNWLADHRVVFTSVATAVLGMWGAFKLLVGVRAIIVGGVAMINKLGAAVELAAIKVKAFGLANSLAVAGIGALVGVGVAVWQQMSEQAAKNAAAIQADQDAIRATLNKTNGAITESTRNWVIHRLAVTGAYDLANKLHVSINTVTDAAMGNKAAVADLTAANKQYANSSGAVLNMDQFKAIAVTSYGAAIGTAQRQLRQQTAAEKAANAAGRASGTQTRAHVRVTQSYGDALRKSAGAVRVTTSALHTHAAATDNDRTATMLLKQETNALKTALSGVAGRLNNAADAIAWQQSLNDLTATIKGNKGAWDGHRAAALADRAAVIGDMQTIVQHAQQMEKNGAKVDRVTNYLKTQYGELRQHAVAAGVDGKQVDALAKKLGIFPRSIKSRLKIDGIEYALSQLSRVRVAIHNLGGGNYTLSSNGSAVGASLNAAGGAITGPGTGTSDSIPARLSNGEHVFTASDVQKAGGQAAMYRLRGAIQAGMMKFAGGGAILTDVIRAGFKGSAARTMAAIAMAESGGNAHAHNYNPSTGDDSYGLAQINLYGSLRSRLRQFHLGSPSALYDPMTNLRVAYALSGGGRNFSPWTTYTSGAYQQFLGAGGAVSNAAGGSGASLQSKLSSTAASAIGKVGAAPGSRKFSVADVGINRIRGQIAHAWDVLHAEMDKGLSSAAAEAFKRELRGYTRLAARELRQLKHALFGRDQRALDHAGAYGSRSDVVTAFSHMLKDAKNAGATARQVDQLTRAEKGLLAIQTQRVKDQATLARMQQRTANMVNYRQGITSTLDGAFDSTRYGSIEDLEAGFTSATGTNRAYTRELHRLNRRDRGKSAGARALRAYVRRLQASGQTATLSTLSHATRGQLAGLEKYLLAYDKSIAGGGAQAVLDKYGESIGRQRKQVGREREQISDLRGDIRLLGRVMAEVATRDVKVNIDGHEIATVVTHSPELEHLLHRLVNHLNYGRKKHP